MQPRVVVHFHHLKDDVHIKMIQWETMMFNQEVIRVSNANRTDTVLQTKQVKEINKGVQYRESGLYKDCDDMWHNDFWFVRWTCKRDPSWI
jgi:hypothetical protein